MGQMSAEHEGAEQALSTLRGIWSAQDQTGSEIAEICGTGKACKSLAGVGFHGLTEDDPDPSATGDLRAAWKDKLDREGKLDARATSVRDLVLGRTDR